MHPQGIFPAATTNYQPHSYPTPVAPTGEREAKVCRAVSVHQQAIPTTSPRLQRLPLSSPIASEPEQKINLQLILKNYGPVLLSRFQEEINFVSPVLEALKEPGVGEFHTATANAAPQSDPFIFISKKFTVEELRDKSFLMDEKQCDIMCDIVFAEKGAEDKFLSLEGAITVLKSKETAISDIQIYEQMQKKIKNLFKSHLPMSYNVLYGISTQNP